MIDSEIIYDFISGFFGYGNPKADFWFVGMEEGGGNSKQEFENRIATWNQLEREKLLDLEEYHRYIGIDKFFSDNAPIQSTWNKLIRIFLSANNMPCSTEDVRQFQIYYLGRRNGETALIELLPLASPNSNEWLFPQWTDFKILSSREKYLSNCLLMRIMKIRNLISEFQPKVMIFYGSIYEKYWQQVIQTSFVEITNPGFKYQIKNNTIFLSIKHPTATGVSNEYFHSVGKWIKEKLLD